MNQEGVHSMEKNLRKMREDRDDLQRYVDDLTIFLPLAFCTVNPLHLILGVNQAFQDLSNYGEMEVIGNEMDTLFLNKEEIEEFKKEISLKKERVTREASLLVKDKEAIPVSISALARRDTDGNFLGYFLTVSDISDIKEFQKRLEQRVNEKTKELADSRLALINILEETDELWKEAEVEKDKTMTVISNFIDGLLLFNKENAIEIINAKAEHFLKIESDEINGLKIEDLVKIEHLSPLLDILFKSKELGKGGEDESDRFTVKERD
jgi:PAS domain S-box-containing protein